ncbi:MULTISPECIES: hypothetical protein [Paenibacillus]|uniref:Uncharacterized protein n=1 Tax=Paenibacillus polymyxa TaxID=1406 RepID=A0ABX2ZH77_PAEPO|nr:MULTISPECIES: hypothetical protein [Paenibacillus]ALA41035.1 hypothetical protein ABE82_05635 [Paenibacillus peoriae]ODA11085.1 hypothetical protein A7312_22535 [Paenibacillus polymyxa]OME70244.1 hypothetical protein BK119_12870 [Paenibacillus peoriae]
MVKSMLNVTCTWDKESISANGSKQVNLLIEWGYGAIRKRKGNLIPKAAGCDLQLQFISENGVSLLKAEGVRLGFKRSENGDSMFVHCGDVRRGKYRQAILTFSIPAHSSGRHTIGMMEWSWRKPSQEKRTLIRTDQLYIHFTHHLGLLSIPSNPKVEKYIKLNETSPIVKKALRMYEKGEYERGAFILTRQADELLILAARSDDMDYLQEAELILAIRNKWSGTFVSFTAYSSKVIFNKAISVGDVHFTENDILR